MMKSQINTPTKICKVLAILLSFLLIFEQSGFCQIAGQLDISGHLAGLRNAFAPDVFRPLHLRYLSYNPTENNFQLFLDKGSLKNPTSQELEDTTKTLLNYFFIGVTLPNDTFWVNLRPDAEDQIIDDRLAQTDVGKIMLETDLQLKKDTARFTSPETPEGKEYWDKLYKKAEEIFGYENITIPTLTRPWIVPDEIIIRETTDSAYIYKATLKVMLEQDYLKDSAVYNFEDVRLKELNEYSSQLIREIIIPKLTKQVNSSKRYASLRQVYYSLIMAQWFKARNKGKDGLYSHLIDRRDLTGLTSKEIWSKTTYFKEYQKSFKDGEYNLQEPVYTPYGQTIRSYFSGGMVIASPELDKALTSGSPVGNKAVFPADKPRNLKPNEIIAEIKSGTREVRIMTVSSALKQEQKELAASSAMQNEPGGLKTTTSSEQNSFDWQSTSFKEMNDEEKDIFIERKFANSNAYTSALWNNWQKTTFPYKVIDSSGKEKNMAVIWDRHNINDKAIKELLEDANRKKTLQQLNNILMDCFIKAIQIFPWRNFKPGAFRITAGDNFNSSGPVLLNVGDQEVRALLEDLRDGDPVKLEDRKTHITASFLHELIHVERDEVVSFAKSAGEIVSQIGGFLFANRVDRRYINTVLEDIEGFRKINDRRQLKSPIYAPDMYAALVLITDRLSSRIAMLKDVLLEDKNPNKIETLRKLADILANIDAEELENLTEELLQEFIYRTKDELLSFATEAEFNLGIAQPIVNSLYGIVTQSNSSFQPQFDRPASVSSAVEKEPAASSAVEQNPEFERISNFPDIDKIIQPRRWIHATIDHDTAEKIMNNGLYTDSKIGLGGVAEGLPTERENAIQTVVNRHREFPYVVVIELPNIYSKFYKELKPIGEGDRVTSLFVEQLNETVHAVGGRTYDAKLPARYIVGYLDVGSGAFTNNPYFNPVLTDEEQNKIEGKLESIKKELLFTWGENDNMSSSSITIDKGNPTIAPGGIDFRSLPIVTQAIGNLSLNTSSSAMQNLISINLNEEWSQIERMASSGITPSSERIKEYIQTSCAQDSITQDRDKILLCISDILRLEEERCDHTNPTLRDILVVLESMGSKQELREVFLGRTI